MGKNMENDKIERRGVSNSISMSDNDTIVFKCNTRFLSVNILNKTFLMIRKLSVYIF